MIELTTCSTLKPNPDPNRSLTGLVPWHLLRRVRCFRFVVSAGLCQVNCYILYPVSVSYTDLLLIPALDGCLLSLALTDCCSDSRRRGHSYPRFGSLLLWSGPRFRLFWRVVTLTMVSGKKSLLRNSRQCVWKACLALSYPRATPLLRVLR